MISSPVQHLAQEEFRKHNLADVLLTLNRACHAAHEGTLVADLPMLNDSDQRIFLWLAAETVRIALCWCREPAFDRSGSSVPGCPPDVRNCLMNFAWELLSVDRLLGTSDSRLRLDQGDLFDNLLRIAEPQYLLQRQSPFRDAQAILMYGEAAKRRAKRDKQFDASEYDSTIEVALGCSIESFVLATKQIQGKSHGPSPLLTAKELIPTENRAYDSTQIYARSSSGLILPAVGAVLSRLSASPVEMTNWMDSEMKRLGVVGERMRLLLEAPNPLHRFPVVRVFRDRDDHCIAPVPHLLAEWLYEPIAAYLYEKADGVGKRRLDMVFEEYVGMLLEICSPDERPWLHESEIMPANGCKVVDWVREFDDVVVMVEAKKAFVGLGARYRSLGIDWTTAFEKNWAKAIVQATEFWQSVQLGAVPLLRHCKHKRPILLVATFVDADSRAGHQTVSERLSPYLQPGGSHVPFVIASIDRLERIVSTWETQHCEWLPRFLNDAVSRGTTVASNELVPTTNGNLARIFAKILDRLKSAIETDK